MKRTCIMGPSLTLILQAFMTAAAAAGTVDLFPRPGEIAKDHPRVLLRAKTTPGAISLEQLKALRHDGDFDKMLEQLRGQNDAGAQALVYLLAGDKAAADKAIARVRTLGRKTSSPFDVWFGLREMALTYDWLHDYPGFTDELKAEVRKSAAPLVASGLPIGDDHVFCNYVWMANSGLAFWALACAGDDPENDKLLAEVRKRFNERLYPAMEYLNGENGDAMGYWYLYCFSPGLQTLLAAQSACGADLVGKIRKEQNDWLAKQFDAMLIGTLPNLRYVPWGDIQDGPDGGVSAEMAINIDAAAWALNSASGKYFSDRLAGTRGLKRFHGATAIGYFLYNRHLAAQPAAPAFRAMLAGGPGGGKVVMRSSWDDDATVVAFRCMDFYARHLHLDQGGFLIYRNGQLAVDAGQYKKPGGTQISTDAHNTLLIGGKGQRRLNWMETIDIPQHVRLLKEKKLETGDMPFFKDAGGWAAAAGQFAQAYDCEELASCARQVLFVRPGTILIVDQLTAAAGKKLPDVQWVVNVPEGAAAKDGVVTADNGKSWLRCRSLLPPASQPEVQPSYPTWLSGDHKTSNVSRMAFSHPGDAKLVLAYLIEVGDGKPSPTADIRPEVNGSAINVTVGGRRFTLSRTSPFAVGSE